MSQEKYHAEGGRWLKQAGADLRAAQNSSSSGSQEWACFQSQQAGEKALKALWLFHQHDPWGHSLVKLIQDYPDTIVHSKLIELLPLAKMLDKLYIPTRYPNGLPDFTPAEVYMESEAQEAIKGAKMIIDFVTQAREDASNSDVAGSGP